MLNMRRISAEDAGLVSRTLAESLRRLRTDVVFGCIVHQCDDLLAEGGECLYAVLLEAKANGKVQKIGASVYDARQLDGVLGRYELDIVQLPLNVFDQRLLRSGHLAELRTRKIEVHIRSVFLQGLLLMPLEEVPPYFAPWNPQLRRYHAWLQQQNLTPLQAALEFMNCVAAAETLVCGINTLEQLEEICAALRHQRLVSDWQPFCVDDPAMVNPSLWKL